MLCCLLIHAFLQCSTAGATSKEPTIQVKRHHWDHRGRNPALQVVTRAPTPVAWSEVRKRHNQDHRRHDPGLQRSHNFLNTTLAPTPVAWSGVGCPIAYVAGTAYLGGSTVVVGTLVYECTTGAASGWCTLEAYKPGTGTAWEQAWTLKGSCIGTIAPTTLSPTTLAPTAVAWSGVGCPIAYVAGTAYVEGSTVAVGTMVYQCKVPGWCTLEAYKPGTGTAWEHAWTLKGSCFGTIAPTTFSPTMYTASPSWPTTYSPTDYTASPFSPNTASPTWPLEPSLAPA